ncbi:hypothetical protein ABZ958_03460 [Streptomyces sp. NPDC046237]|uniref:hypothetical protein n=1 Tax=Streptomyces sp. NPDC046237 TaxID=3154914 RepID=UPI0033D1E7CB
MSGAGFVWRSGEVVDLPGPEASAWADGVRAELVRDEPIETPEAGTAKPERQARKRTSSARGRRETRST